MKIVRRLFKLRNSMFSPYRETLYNNNGILGSRVVAFSALPACRRAARSDGPAPTHARAETTYACRCACRPLGTVGSVGSVGMRQLSVPLRLQLGSDTRKTTAVCGPIASWSWKARMMSFKTSLGFTPSLFDFVWAPLPPLQFITTTMTFPRGAGRVSTRPSRGACLRMNLQHAAMKAKV
jgi:hypothetical protein